MNCLNNTIITFLILLSFVFTNDEQLQINKKLDLYYIASFSDFEIINLPFRIIDINYKRQSGDFELYSNLALELNMRNENYFLENSSISKETHAKDHIIIAHSTGLGLYASQVKTKGVLLAAHFATGIPP